MILSDSHDDMLLMDLCKDMKWMIADPILITTQMTYVTLIFMDWTYIPNPTYIDVSNVLHESHMRREMNLKINFLGCLLSKLMNSYGYAEISSTTKEGHLCQVKVKVAA